MHDEFCFCSADFEVNSRQDPKTLSEFAPELCIPDLLPKRAASKEHETMIRLQTFELLHIESQQGTEPEAESIESPIPPCESPSRF
jgi:hypothetical protein